MQFRNVALNFALVGGVIVSASQCGLKVLPASSFSVNDSLNHFQISEAQSAKGFSTVFDAASKLHGTVKFETVNGKLQYSLELNNEKSVDYSITLAIFNKGTIANWVALPVSKGQDLTGCAVGDISALSNKDISYAVGVSL